jgi:hypothetical protein
MSKFSEKVSSLNHKVVYGVLVVLLLLSFGYIYYSNNKSTKIIHEKEIQYLQIDSSKDVLQLQYDESILKLNYLTSQNSGLDSTLKTKIKELNILKYRIKKIIHKQNLTNSEFRKAHRLIQVLNEMIEDLSKENDKLKLENHKLSDEKEVLIVKNNELEKVLLKTEEEKKIAENKVDIGSTLSVSDMKVIGINVKHNKKEKITDKFQKIDKLNLSFNINENKISNSGTKEIYIIVINPLDNLILDKSSSGSFVSREEGEKEYTIKTAIDYRQGAIQKFSFDINLDEKYVDGVYKVKIYENGFKIGESNISLKDRKILGIL